MTPPAPTRVFVQLALCTLIWGSTWMVIRTQLGVVPVAWSVTYRFVAAAVVMFAFCILTRRPLRLGKRGHLFALGAALLQFVANYNFVYHAEKYVTSGVVATVFALLVVPNAALAWIFYRHRVSARFAIGSALGIAGVGMLFSHELAIARVGDGGVILGFLLTGGAILSASLANVMQAGGTAKSLPAYGLLATSLSYGAIMDAGLALATAGAPVIDLSPSYLAGVLYLGVIASALAFALYYDAIRAVGPTTAAYSSLVIPFVAMALSTLFEGYRWTLLAMGGGLLVVLGLYVSLSARRPAS